MILTSDFGYILLSEISDKISIAKGDLIGRKVNKNFRLKCKLKKSDVSKFCVLNHSISGTRFSKSSNATNSLTILAVF